MSYLSFTLLTDTPGRLRTFLIARGIFKNLAGVSEFTFEGGEWVEIPNPIIKTQAVGTFGQPGYVPPVMDTRRCFMVKLARAAKDDEEAGEALTDPDGTPRTLAVRTKLGKWVVANSVADPLIGWIGTEAVSIPARRVGTALTGTWFTLRDLGAWQ